MTTLTQMEKTATGWKCPACEDTFDPGPMDIARAVECNCEGPGRPPIPRKGLVSADVANAGESERLAAWATVTSEDMEASREQLDAITGIPDAFRHGIAVTLTREQLRDRYRTEDEEEFYETGPNGGIVTRRRRVVS